MTIPDESIGPDVMLEPSEAPAPPGLSTAHFAPTLSKYQAVLGFVATVLSVGGTGLTLPRMLISAAHGSPNGDVAIVVRDARVGSAVTNASIEILTTEDALITTVTSDPGGLAHHSLKEGRYHVRVRHPRYAMDAQPVVVMKGQRTVVPVRLRDDVPAAAPAGGARSSPHREAPHPRFGPPASVPREPTPPQAG